MIRNRVMVSLSLLFGAKVMNVTVPFLFKYAVDEVNMATASTGDVLLGMATVPQALGTTAVSLLLGCMTHFFAITFSSYYTTRMPRTFMKYHICMLVR